MISPRYVPEGGEYPESGHGCIGNRRPSKLRVIEAISSQHARSNRPSVFLAGGITGCSDWQQEVIERLTIRDPDLTLFNPRRADFPIDDPEAAERQIAWEHSRLDAADAIAFYFAPETVQPIVMFEFGRWLSDSKPLFVAVHPEYQRRADVLYQAALEQPKLVIGDSINDIVEGIDNYAKLLPWIGPRRVL